MKLSQNIAIEQLVKDLLLSSYPQIKQLVCIRYLPNGSLQISDTIDLHEDLQMELVEFIDSSNSGWYAETETPLSYAPAIGQLDLEDELGRTHLVVKLESDQISLGILAQFTPFGLTTTHYLSSAEKKIIEQSIKGFTASFIQTYVADKKILQQIAFANGKLQEEVRSLQSELKEKDKRYQQAFTKLLHTMIMRLQKILSIRLVMSEEFTKAVLEYKGSLNELEKHLEKSLMLEANLAMLKSENELILQPSHLADLKFEEPVAVSRSKDLTLGRLSKASSLLDRYETAAQKLRNAGLSIIGKNIGSYCDPPISNAAITDSLNKYSKKVYELFEKYPDKWPIIRHEFRSVANLIEKESLRRQTG